MILAVVGFLLFFSVSFRVALFHPLAFVYYGLRDAVLYFVHKDWRIFHTGELLCYTALFGKGKTLSAVHYVVNKYRKYNNKRIYDVHRKKWVTQKVHIISNVHINRIPYEKFVSLEQIVTASEYYRGYDKKNNTLTCLLVLGDEFSVQLNSREFKKNIDPLFLNTLLICRHHHITIVYTTQRFKHVDALLRQVTSKVISCRKSWRFVVHCTYDAQALEYASDPTCVKPQARFGWFVRNRDYARYDTLACVDNLIKDMRHGGMMSEAEILALQSPAETDMDMVMNPSRKWRRAMKKRR